MASIPVWALSLILLAWGLAGFAAGYFASSRSKKAECWHHEKSTGNSWIAGQLINMGMGKMFTCSKCGKMWFV